MTEIFFNFPIWLLRNAPDMHKVGGDIVDYAVYAHCTKLSGSKIERTKAAAEYFDITLGNVLKTAENGLNLYLNTSSKEAFTGISANLLFDFYEGDHSNFEVATLLAALAMKSIKGKRSYTRVTKELLFSRMAGYTSLKNDYPGLPEWLEPFTTRRRFDRLKSEVQRVYGWKIYARYTRGFFITDDSLTLEELIEKVEIKRKKYFEAQNENNMSKAVTKVLRRLYEN